MERYSNLLKSVEGNVRKFWNTSVDTVYPFVQEARIDPNVITTIGGVAGVMTGYFISEGKFWHARGAFGISALADGVDGYIARKQGMESKYGEFLDSVLDRFTDVFILTGMSNYAKKQGWETVHILAQLARPLAIMPSYARVLADEYDVEIPKFDIGSRLSRMAAITICLAAPEDKREVIWKYGLGFVAASACITTLHRLKTLLSAEEDRNGAPIDRGQLITKLSKTVGERLAWELMDTDFARFLGDMGLVKQYVKEKEALIVQSIPHEDVAENRDERQEDCVT